VIVVVLALVAGFGLYWFAPWRLFTNKTVNETLSSPAPAATAVASTEAGAGTGAPAAGPVLLAQGTFVTHEHETSGSVRVVRLPDGTRQLEIVGLDTSDGPDLRVWLTDQTVMPGRAGWDVFDDGKYVELGKLKGNRGDQVYPIPSTVDLASFRSVSIWCKRFSVSFGAAQLA
jgi:hypothetical protein